MSEFAGDQVYVYRLHAPNFKGLAVQKPHGKRRFHYPFNAFSGIKRDPFRQIWIIQDFNHGKSMSSHRKTDDVR